MDKTVLAQTIRNEETADKVNAILAEAKAFGIPATRRAARHAVQGHGNLLERLKPLRRRANLEAALDKAQSKSEKTRLTALLNA